MQFYAKVCVRCDSIRTKLTLSLCLAFARSIFVRKQCDEGDRWANETTMRKKQKGKNIQFAVSWFRCYGFCECLQNILKLQKDFKTISCTFCLRSFLPSRHFFL